jgi:hypothetical protein
MRKTAAGNLNIYSRPDGTGLVGSLPADTTPKAYAKVLNVHFRRLPPAAGYMLHPEGRSRVVATRPNTLISF